jgi:hypothetical protein
LLFQSDPILLFQSFSTTVEARKKFFCQMCFCLTVHQKVFWDNIYLFAGISLFRESLARKPFQQKLQYLVLLRADDILSNDILSNDILSNGILSNDIPSNDIPSNDIPLNDIPLNDIPSNTFHQMTFHQMTFCQITFCHF